MGSSCSSPGNAATSNCAITYGACTPQHTISITCTEENPTGFGCGYQYINSIMNIPASKIPDIHTITDIDVWVRLNHVYIGDVEAGVFHNDDPRRLFNRASCSANNMLVTFDDESSGAIINSGTPCDSSSAPAFKNTHKPEQSLSHFDGNKANGEWRLEVQDSVNNDDGTFYEWGITLTVPTFCTDAPTPAPTDNPTKYPSKYPTISPTKFPTKNPSITPTKYPTKIPSISPSKYPSINPSKSPTKYPSTFPSNFPSYSPSINPSKYPTYRPTLENAVDIDTTHTVDVTNGVKGGLQGINSSNSGFKFDQQMSIIIGLSGVLALIFCCLIIACICIYRKRNAKHKVDFETTNEMERVTSASEPGLGGITSDSAGIVGEGDTENTGTLSNGNNEMDTTDGAQYQMTTPMNNSYNTNNIGMNNMNMMGMNNNMNMMNQFQMMNQMNAQMNMMQNLQMNMMAQPLPGSERILSYSHDANNSIVPSENDEIGPFVQMNKKRDTAGNINIATAGNVSQNIVADVFDDDDDDDEDENGLYGRKNNVAKTKQ